MKFAKLTGIVLLASAGAVLANDETKAQAGATGAKSATITTQSSTVTSQRHGFDKLDTNKDGYLSKTEAQVNCTGDAYTAADRDTDGRLDRAEFSAWEMAPQADSTTRSTQGSSTTTRESTSTMGSAHPAHSFDSLDSNKDGYLTKSEAEGKLGTGDKYGDADRNADGRLDRAEFSAWEMSDKSKDTDTMGKSTGTLHQSKETMHESSDTIESQDTTTDPSNTMQVP